MTSRCSGPSASLLKLRKLESEKRGPADWAGADGCAFQEIYSLAATQPLGPIKSFNRLRNILRSQVNFEQMSRSLRSFLFMWLSWFARRPRRHPTRLKRDDLGMLRTKFSHCGDEIDRVASAADRKYDCVAPLAEDRSLKGARRLREWNEFPGHGV